MSQVNLIFCPYFTVMHAGISVQARMERKILLFDGLEIWANLKI